MNNKKAGRAAGIAFIAGTAAGVSCLSFVNVIRNENFLADIAANPTSLKVGALLIVIMGIACAAIAYSIFPVLSKYHKGLASGAAGFRTMEAALTLASAGALLSLIPLAQGYASAGTETFALVGGSVIGLYDSLGIGLTIAFIAGALCYNIGFFKTKLVPRWLSLWGIIALALHLCESTLTLFNVFESFSAPSVILNVPIALQEMVMAVWLIAVGFAEIKTPEQAI